MRKKRTRVKRMPKAPAHVFIRYSIAVFSLACLILFLQFTFQTFQGSRVLGENTGEFVEREKKMPEVILQQFEKHASKEGSVFCKSPEGKVLQTSPAICEKLKKMWNHEVMPPKEKKMMPMPSKIVEKRDVLIKRLEQKREDKKEGRVEIKKQGEDMFVLKEGSIEAKTKFPLSLNPTTNQLTVTTPRGEKVVAILPEQAVANLLSHKIINKLDIKENDASSSVTLTEKENKPVFEIAGLSDQHLFGIFPVKIRKSLDVSAQTGQVVSEDTSFGQRLLDFLSF